jgi:hypothetical protein
MAELIGGRLLDIDIQKPICQYDKFLKSSDDCVKK